MAAITLYKTQGNDCKGSRSSIFLFQQIHSLISISNQNARQRAYLYLYNIVLKYSLFLLYLLLLTARILQKYK